VGKLTIDKRSVDAAPVLSLRGDLDMAGVAEFELMLSHTEASCPEVILIDLRRVSFLDSSGLRVLLGADARAKAASRKLLLVRGPDVVHRVFEIALLDRRFTFVDAPETASYSRQ
jgi:anti-sigma B factor antagonist